MVTQAHSQGTSETKAGRSEIQRNHHLHRESKASLGYMRPCLKQKDEKWKKREDRERGRNVSKYYLVLSPGASSII